MAELRFHGRETVPFPFYYNPNIWTVVGADPTTALIAAPQVNSTTWIWCSVANTGTQSVSGVTVKFYVRDPSAVLKLASGPPLGTSTVALLAGETKEVLCVTPWIPTWFNDGHECVICEVGASADPAYFPPDEPWNLSDRHVAQRNLQLVPSASGNRFSLASIVILGLANELTAKVSIRAVPDKLFAAALKSIGLEEIVKKNVTSSCSFGLLGNYRCSNPLPGNPTRSKEIKIELKANDQGSATAVVQGPSDGWGEGTAGLFFIEQLDKKGSVIGGSAVMVANLSGGSQTDTVDSSEATEFIQKIPASIPYRPYSTRTDTRLMNFDGVFVANYGSQYISVEPRNDGSDSLSDLSIYIEGASNSNIPITSSVNLVRRPVEPNATFKSQFLADFSNATPGQTILSFIIQDSAARTFIRIIKKIFVTRIEYDTTTKGFFVPFPQGILEMHIKTGILHGQSGGIGRDQCKCCCVCQCKDGGQGNQISVSPAFIKAATMTWRPTPAYSGVHGPLPFNDPWNKLALGILAGILALLGGTALLIDHALRSGGGGGGSETKVEVSVGGTFEETDQSISCCNKVKVGSTTNTVLEGAAAGLFAAAGYVATSAIASDEVDFFYRGQEQTVPKDGEFTVSEFVSFVADYAETPGRTLNYETENAYDNPHYLSKYTIQIDGRSSPDNHYTHSRLIRRPLTICAQFIGPDPNKHLFLGNELYVTALIWTDTGRTRFYELRDDGVHDKIFDFEPNTGNYCVEIPTSLDDPAGTWYVFVFAQNVNTVLDGTDQYTAAKTIGGFVLTPQLVVNLEAGGARPCELNYDVVVTVI